MVRITLNKPMPEIPDPVVITAVKYGLLYNWYAATDERNICADGWIVPSNSEWDDLITYIGGESTAGYILRETGTVYWNSNYGTNNYGFSARGAGYRDYIPVFTNLNRGAIFWSSDEIGSNGWKRTIYNNLPQVGIYFDPKNYGESIRLVKNSTTLTHGQTGTYTGNDGKVYRTICIGTQEWLADNLAETKYRNGDTIPEVTDNAEWSTLTTGALCAYNNDWTNVLI